MNSLKTPLIIFAVVLLALVGGALVIGDPEGVSETATLSGVTDILPELGLNEEELLTCVESGEFDERVTRDLQLANTLRLTGTPAVYIVDTQTNNAVLARGSYPFEILAQVIQDFLNDALVLGDTAFESEELGVKLVVEQFEGLNIVEDDHLRGNPEARIALIEFSDLDCPYCATFHGTALNLVNEFTEDLVWVYRHMPLASIHPVAFSKSVATECAQKLGGDDAFWGIVDSYYAASNE